MKNRCFRFAICGEERTSKAFTLAEVLITLGIIGVVAAMTIPTLTRSYQKRITEVRLEHYYSMMMQAIKMSINDNGEVSGWSDVIEKDDENYVKELNNKYIMKYIKGASDCAYIPSLASLSNDEKSTLISKCGTINDSFSVIYKLQNGSCISLSPEGTSLSRSYRFYSTIDINCGQKPNQIGKDYFGFFFMTDGRFIPSYYSNDLTREDILNGTTVNPIYHSNNRTFGCTNNSGVTYPKHLCGALIMLDGWKILEDNPW